MDGNTENRAYMATYLGIQYIEPRTNTKQKHGVKSMSAKVGDRIPVIQLTRFRGKKQKERNI